MMNDWDLQDQNTIMGTQCFRKKICYCDDWHQDVVYNLLVVALGGYCKNAFKRSRRCGRHKEQQRVSQTITSRMMASRSDQEDPLPQPCPPRLLAALAKPRPKEVWKELTIDSCHQRKFSFLSTRLQKGIDFIRSTNPL